jgi:hypothetical protein
VTIEESIEKREIEFPGNDLRDAILPPARRHFAVMKLHAPKLAGIAKNERPFALIQHQVVMLFRAKTRTHSSHSSGHPKMQPEPILVRKSKEHSFAARFGTQQLRSGQLLTQSARVGSAKDAFPSVQGDAGNPMPNPDVPTPPKILHLGQLRHGET